MKSYEKKIIPMIIIILIISLTPMTISVMNGWMSQNIFIGFLLVLILPYVLATLFGYLFVELGSRINIILFKKFIRTKSDIGVYKQKEERQTTVLDILKRAILPAILALNLSLILSQYEQVQAIVNVLDLSTVENLHPALIQFLTIMLLIPITTTISIAVIAPIWGLHDLKLVYVDNYENPKEILTLNKVGDWYNSLIKGYAGIGTIVLYIQFLLFYWSYYTQIDVVAIMILVTQPIAPLIMAFTIIPFLLINERTKTKRNEKIIDYLKKHQLNYKVEIDCKITEDN